MTTSEPAASSAAGPASISPLASFWAGLTRPSLVSAFGILLFALAEFGALCAFVTPRRLARIDARFLMENPRDDYAKLTIDALRLKYGHDPGLSLVYMGASTGRLSLLHSESPKLIQDYLTAQSGERVTFHMLCTDAQTLEDVLLLTDQIPSDFRGLVVMMVADTRDDDRSKEIREHDTKLHAEARVALDSPSDDAFALSQGDELQHRTGIYFLDYLKFFALRRVSGARLVKSPPRPQAENIRRPQTPEEQVAYARHMALGWQMVRRDFESHEKLAIMHRYLPLLETIVATWKKRGLTGVLVEAPANPRYDALKGDNFRAEYEAEMRAFAERVGVPYWDVNPELNLDQKDFFDHIHLGDKAARFRFQAAFLRRAAVLMRGMSRTPPEHPDIFVPQQAPPAADAPDAGAADAGPENGSEDDVDGGAKGRDAGAAQVKPSAPKP